MSRNDPQIKAFSLAVGVLRDITKNALLAQNLTYFVFKAEHRS